MVGKENETAELLQHQAADITNDDLPITDFLFGLGYTDVSSF